MERSCSVRRPRRRLLRREVPVRFAAFAVFSSLAIPAAAQEGGVVAEFCKGDPWCVDDALEIVFESGTSTYEGPLGVGVEVPIEVVLDVKSPDIQGYSWAVKHDGDVLALIADRVTTAGTIIDPESPDTVVKGEHFIVHRAVEGGFIAAVVLSLRDRATLPLGRNVICRAAYHIASTPECTVIRFVHLQLAPANGHSSVAVNITTNPDGRTLSGMPRVFRHGLIRTSDCAETCDDLADNDGDGLADCDDPDCAADFRCTGEEVCDDGTDNNSDGRVDCHVWEVCADGLDNDGDGATDCDDRDCGASPGCRPPEVCNDGTDNDGDGLTDCDDRDCWTLPACRIPEACDDGIDNDRDGSTDCRDPDCRGGVACLETCDDGIDNDLDSLTDCHDRDCSGVGGCPEFEVCDDGRDNDEDGLTDCDDPECRWQNPCVEVCDDGIDNDEDGFVDGLDRDCFPRHVDLPAGAPPPPSAFLRGDADGDGRLTVLDAVLLIQILIRAADPRDDCREALNPDGDDGISFVDALHIVRWIFLDGPPPPPPFPVCETTSWCGRSQAACR